MNGKIVFFDIDGTIYCNEYGCVLPSTIKALKQLRENNIKIAIATGRAYFMLYSIKDIMEYIDYFVLINGQHIIDKQQSVIYESYYKNDYLIQLLDDMDKLNIIYGFEGAYSEGISKIDNSVEKAFVKLGLNLPPVDKYFYKQNKVYQMWAFSDEATIRKLGIKHPNLQYIKWGDVGYDILPKNTSKGEGMLHLINKLGYDIKDTYAFGDGDNDYELVKFAEVGIAMGNATSKVKEVSNYITNEYNKDGIYNALKHYKLIK